MEPVNKKSKFLENPDENCRLQLGLNIHCLAHIFQWGACDRMQFLLNYSAEILSNVETIKLMIVSRIFDWEFIKSVPKLGELFIIPRKTFDIYGGPTDWQATKIVSNLKVILKKRTTEGNNCNDFIELKVDESYFEIFCKIDQIDQHRLILEQFDN